MRYAVFMSAWLAVPVAVADAAAPPNVVVETVRPIRVAEPQPDTATLLVFVVDDAGDPIDSVRVAVLAAGREAAAEESDARGRVLLRLRMAGRVVVRAGDAGLVTAEARGVEIRKGRLTALVLPLQAEESGREK